MQKEYNNLSEILDDMKKKMSNAKEHLKQELNRIRTGRANPALLEDIHVDVYGTQMRLKDISNITVPEARQLLITPFDTNNINSIGKSIEKANIGFMPIIEGNAIRINIPPMDESQRMKEVKRIKEEGEKEGKVPIRNIRREFNNIVKDQKKRHDVSEDMIRKEEKEIQKITDSFCNEIDAMIIAKEKEIMSI